MPETNQTTNHQTTDHSRETAWVFLRSRGHETLGMELSMEDAMSVAACTVEDVRSMEELRLVWSRYDAEEPTREPSFLQPSPLTQVHIYNQAEKDSCWVWIDMEECVLALSSAFQWNLEADSETDRITLIETAMPQHWEARKAVSIEDAMAQRASALRLPSPAREVLWGLPWLEFLAASILTSAEETNHSLKSAVSDFYKVVVSIHKQWLLQPRSDLDGRCPRECIHEDLEWSHALAEWQYGWDKPSRFERKVPCCLASYQQAPWGKHEAIMYFEATRDVLDFAKSWINTSGVSGSVQNQSRLVKAMKDHLQRWLQASFEDGPSPSLIIERERARVPLLEDISHENDCQCPICRWMGHNAAPALVMMDGLSLELDQEFAFSLTTHREDWEWENDWMSEEEDDDDDDEFFEEVEDEFSLPNAEIQKVLPQSLRELVRPLDKLAENSQPSNQLQGILLDGLKRPLFRLKRTGNVSRKSIVIPSGKIHELMNVIVQAVHRAILHSHSSSQR